MKTRTWILLVVVVAIMGAGIWAWVATRSAVSVRLETAKTGPVEAFLVERGKTRLPKTYLVTMPLAGRIEAITLEEGAPVKQGQTVAQMVALDLDLDVEEATAAVERLEAAIRENDETNVYQTALKQSKEFVASMADTVKAAWAQVESGKAEYDYAKKNYGRIAPLVPRGVKTEDDLDQARLLEIQSDAGYRQDKLVYSAMQAMEAATNLMPTMVDQYIGNKALSGAVLQKQLAEATARRRQIVEDQRRGKMVSPIDGVVLERFVTDEQFLPAGTKLLELGRLEDIEVEAEVLTQEAVDVQLGDAVEIFGPAVGKPAARGTVTRIYPAGFTKISSLGVEQQRVKVIVRIEPEDIKRLLRERHLEVGYRVYVRIITAREARAMVIPRAALFRGSESQWQVFAVRGGRAKLEKVEIGLLNDQWAQVTKGLAEGDHVIVAPESSLMDGTRVGGEQGP